MVQRQFLCMPVTDTDCALRAAGHRKVVIMLLPDSRGCSGKDGCDDPFVLWWSAAFCTVETSRPADDVAQIRWWRFGTPQAAAQVGLERGCLNVQCRGQGAAENEDNSRPLVATI